MGLERRERKERRRERERETVREERVCGSDNATTSIFICHISIYLPHVFFN